MIETYDGKQFQADELDETDRLILEAAAEHFAKDGYGKTVVESIAVAAGVGNGTVYRRFGNKEKLFAAALQNELRSLWGALASAVDLESDPIQAIRNLSRALSQYYHDRPHVLQLVAIERIVFGSSVLPAHLQSRHAYRRMLVELIDRIIAPDREGFDISADEAATALLDLLYGSAFNGVLECDRPQLMRRMETAIELFLRGLIGDRIAPLHRNTTQLQSPVSYEVASN